jgi:hypothetical protein
MLVVAAVLFVPSVVLAEDPSVRLDDIHISPDAPSVRVFVARRRPQPRLEELRASFTSEIVSSASSTPF